MQHHVVDLTDEQFEELNSAFPESNGSGLIGSRAEAIVKIYFRGLDPKCEFVAPLRGADLAVKLVDGAQSTSIEVKGTASADLAWEQLKVSSKHSWELLTTVQVLVYRVCKVFRKSPSIHILMHGEDFVLQPEPRWTFKRVPRAQSGVDSDDFKPKASPHPLSTKSIRFSKYDSLKRFLLAQVTDDVTLDFERAEELIGFPLPDSAKKYQAYWANQSDTTNRPWARSWQDAGFEVNGLRLSEHDGWVRFRRLSK